MILSGELEPTNEGYALAKIMTTRLCQYICTEDSSFAYKSLIPCNLYGRYDKFANEHPHLVAAIFSKVHLAMEQGKTSVEIWGDGTARREFMYAGDLADAALKAAAEIETIPDIMNIGVGSDLSVREYYESIAKVVGWSGQFIYTPRKPVGMRQKLASTALQKQWGWEPKTSLVEGLDKTYEFYRENRSNDAAQNLS